MPQIMELRRRHKHAGSRDGYQLSRHREEDSRRFRDLMKSSLGLG